MTMSKSTQAIEPEIRKPLVVMKLGGSILYALSSEFYQSLRTLQENYHVIIVHGGGPEITSMLQKLHIESTFVDGQRKTSESVLQVVEMSLKGKVNSYLVNRLNGVEIKAIGLTGYDGGLLCAQLIDVELLGFVGKIETVNHTLLTDLLSLGYLPVIAPLAVTSEGVKVNVNADLAAAAIAHSLQVEKLVFVTDVPGVLKNGEIIPHVSKEEIHYFIQSGIIYGGMIPKVNAALSVLTPKIKEVMIVGGKQSIYEDGKVVGTKITEEGVAAKL